MAFSLPAGQLVAHRVHQVRFTQTHAAIKEQRVIGATGILGDLAGGGTGQLVRLTLDEGLEGEVGIEAALVLEAALDLYLALTGRPLGPLVTHLTDLTLVGIIAPRWRMHRGRPALDATRRKPGCPVRGAEALARTRRLPTVSDTLGGFAGDSSRISSLMRLAYLSLTQSRTKRLGANRQSSLDSPSSACKGRIQVLNCWELSSSCR